MEDKLAQTKERIAEKLNFPKNIMLNIPKITVTGDNEIEIENHRGIIFFGEEEVKINSNVGLISIKGCGFEILFIGGNTIIISGKFKSILYDNYA